VDRARCGGGARDEGCRGAQRPGERRGAGPVHRAGGHHLQKLHVAGELLDPVREIRGLPETPQRGVVGGDRVRGQISKAAVHHVRLGRNDLQGVGTGRSQPTGSSQPTGTGP